MLFRSHLNDSLGYGGVETNLLNLIRSTDKDSFECLVGTAAKGELEEDFKALGVRLFRFSGRLYELKSVFGIFAIARIFLFIIKNRIDIVHTHSFRTQIWGGLAARLAGRKLVEHVHEFRYLDSDEFVLRRGAGVRYRYSGYFGFCRTA